MSARTLGADLLFAGRRDDELLTLAEVASLLPGRRRGRSMSPRVLLRWALGGLRGQRLRTLRIGQRHVVAVGELRRFLAATAPGGATSEVRTSAAAEQRLRARRAALARHAAEEALR